METSFFVALDGIYVEYHCHLMSSIEGMINGFNSNKIYTEFKTSLDYINE